MSKQFVSQRSFPKQGDSKPKTQKLAQLSFHSFVKDGVLEAKKTNITT